MLTTVNSTSPAHGEDDNEDSEAISPPGSTEVDDVDDGAFEAVAEYDDFRHPLSLENGEEDIVGEAIEVVLRQLWLHSGFSREPTSANMLAELSHIWL
jgi:hypothetical protein